MSLFQCKRFIGASGLHLTWKVECEALTPDDWDALAHMAMELPGLRFGRVIGVPRGGAPFAAALEPYATVGPVLVVDDVLTTGGSLMRVMAQHEGSIGLVAFARGPLPRGVRAVWRLGGAGG